MMIMMTMRSEHVVGGDGGSIRDQMMDLFDEISATFGVSKSQDRRQPGWRVNLDPRWQTHALI